MWDSFGSRCAQTCRVTWAQFDKQRTHHLTIRETSGSQLGYQVQFSTTRSRARNCIASSGRKIAFTIVPRRLLGKWSFMVVAVAMDASLLLDFDKFLYVFWFWENCYCFALGFFIWIWIVDGLVWCQIKSIKMDRLNDVLIWLSND